MNRPGRALQMRIEGLRLRIEELSSLRRLVELPPGQDITRRQWMAIESQLTVVQADLTARLKSGGRAYLPHSHEPRSARDLNALLGQVELELAKAYAFFDTYMDILTQRHPPMLGRLLAGCDALAWDAINRDHPALAIVERPLVYCDRGFGASTVREGVKLPGGSPNPVPIVQIPYSRLKEKYNLVSIWHELGHTGMDRLGLLRTLPVALRAALKRFGASQTLQDYFGLWSSEIGPDFWAFCGTGVASAGCIKEILALPPEQAFRITWADSHPPPYLRALLVFDWCRRMWGADPVDEWQELWRIYYPLSAASSEVQNLLREATASIPVITHTLFHTRFRVLNGKRIPDLFDLAALAPARLGKVARQAGSGTMDLRGLPPGAQLAVFRLIKEDAGVSEEMLDGLMTSWLLRLGRSAGETQSQPTKEGRNV